MKNYREDCDEVQPLKLKEVLKEHHIPFEEEQQENAIVIKIHPKNSSGMQSEGLHGE
jgi:hypothetical protein